MLNTGRHMQRRWAVVTLLGLLYVVSFVDRLMLALLVAPVRAEFGLSDTQIGLLLGPAFALFMGALALPSGWMIDRMPRIRMILGGVLLWSAATLLTGFAESFAQLALFRVGVAIGEAVLFPAAVSLIGDLFERERRADAISLFVGFGMVGGFGAFVLGGAVLGLIGPEPISILGHEFAPWRVAFAAVALPGLILASILALTVSEPDRQHAASEDVTVSLSTFAGKWTSLFLPLFVAAAASQSIILGISSWMPTLLARNFGWTPGNSGIVFGIVALCSGLMGLAIVPRMAALLLSRHQAQLLPVVAAISIAIGTMLLVFALTTGNALNLLAFLALAYLFLAGTATWAIITIQWLVPSALTGRLSGTYMVLNAIIGMGLGPLVVPLMSDYLGGPHHIATGMIALTVGAGTIACGLFIAARRPFEMLARQVELADTDKRITI